MIVSTLSCFSTLLWCLLITISLWPGAAYAQLTRPDLTEEQALAQIKAQLGQEHPEAALPLIERFLDRSGQLAFIDRFTFWHAVTLEAQGQQNQAVSTFEQFLEEYPGSPLVHDARLRLGALYTELRQSGHAISVLSRVLDLTSNETKRAEARRRLCLAYESNEEYLRAIQTALAHVEQSETNARWDFLDYVQTLILHTLNEQALGEVFETFPGTYPGDLALIRLIELHLAGSDETLAERDIRAFLQHFPGHLYAQTATALLRNVLVEIKAHRHVIATVLPFSGKMKPFGTEALNGVRLALDKAFGGSNAVGLVVKDSVVPPAQFRRELSQLLDEFTPIALIGPLLSREVQLVADTPDLAEVPFITPTATLADVRQFGRYWFSTAMTPSFQINRLVEYATQHFGHTYFCILTPETPHGEQLRHLFQQAVVRNGGKVIAAERYQPGTTDASRQITRIKEKDLSLYGTLLPLTTEEPGDPDNKPVKKHATPKDGQEEPPLVYTPGFDALFLPGHPTDVAFLAAQLAFFDVKGPLLGTNTWNHPNLLKWGHSAIEGGVFGDALFLRTTDPETRRFITAYRERFQADPSMFAVQAYDAMRMILDTIRHGATTGADVSLQLFIRHDLAPLGGLAKFDKGGILTRKVYMIQIQNGRFVQVY